MELRVSAGEHSAASTPLIVWPDYLYQDYAGAAVRLATVAEAGASYLLFACVELFPHEVPLPPALPPERRNVGASRLIFSLSPLSVNEALQWYERASVGHLTVPRTAFTVIAAPLGPEPMLGRLVSPDDVEFAPRWHAGPRLHRLVPLADPPPAIAGLAASERPTERQKAARSWLAERLHFDVLAQDEWIGGAGLLVPNPVARSFRMSIVRSGADGRETVRVHAPLRRGVSNCSLSVRFREVRFGAFTTVEEIGLDPHGRAEFQLPEPTREVIVELQCRQRGLLAVEGPQGFVRSIDTNIDVVSRQVTVEVPSPRKGEKPTAYRKEVRTRESFEVGTSPLPNPARRLIALKERRRRRTGEAWPDALWARRDIEEAVFHDDREAAASVIRDLIGRARRKVAIVDPFFDHVALRDFALATSYREVSVQVLLGREHLRNPIALPDGSARPLGEILASELDEIARRFSIYGLPVPDLRLMGNDCRKYHDRFLLTDEDAWHCGHSFNQVGRGEVSAMTRLRHPEELGAAILADLDRADRFEDAWREIVAEPVAASADPDPSFDGTLLGPWIALWTGWLHVWAGVPSCSNGGAAVAGERRDGPS